MKNILQINSKVDAYSVLINNVLWLVFFAGIIFKTNTNWVTFIAAFFMTAIVFFSYSIIRKWSGLKQEFRVNKILINTAISLGLLIMIYTKFC